jgi:hypothetical protein
MKRKAGAAFQIEQLRIWAADHGSHTPAPWSNDPRTTPRGPPFPILPGLGQTFTPINPMVDPKTC